MFDINNINNIDKLFDEAINNVKNGSKLTDAQVDELFNKWIAPTAQRELVQGILNSGKTKDPKIAQEIANIVIAKRKDLLKQSLIDNCLIFGNIIVEALERAKEICKNGVQERTSQSATDMKLILIKDATLEGDKKIRAEGLKKLQAQYNFVTQYLTSQELNDMISQPGTKRGWSLFGIKNRTIDKMTNDAQAVKNSLLSIQRAIAGTIKRVEEGNASDTAAMNFANQVFRDLQYAREKIKHYYGLGEGNFETDQVLALQAADKKVQVFIFGLQGKNANGQVIGPSAVQELYQLNEALREMRRLEIETQHVILPPIKFPITPEEQKKLDELDKERKQIEKNQELIDRMRKELDQLNKARQQGSLIDQFSRLAITQQLQNRPFSVQTINVNDDLKSQKIVLEGQKKVIEDLQEQLAAARKKLGVTTESVPPKIIIVDDKGVYKVFNASDETAKEEMANDINRGALRPVLDSNKKQTYKKYAGNVNIPIYKRYKSSIPPPIKLNPQEALKAIAEKQKQLEYLNKILKEAESDLKEVKKKSTVFGNEWYPVMIGGHKIIVNNLKNERDGVAKEIEALNEILKK